MIGTETYEHAQARRPAALEAGADPAIVAGWMAEVQAQRTVAEARLRQGSGRQRMPAEEITRVVSSLRDLMSVSRETGD